MTVLSGLCGGVVDVTALSGLCGGVVDVTVLSGLCCGCDSPVWAVLWM